jgi:hypothetical protein
MSLINEALKKAQSQRTGGPGDVPGGAGSSLGAHGARRGKSMPAQTLALIVAGVAIVATLTVITTVYFLNRETPATHPAPRPVAARPAPPATEPAASPVIVAPSLPPPTVKIELPTQPPPAPVRPPATVAETRPQPEPAVTAPPSVVVQAPVTVAPTPSPVAAAPVSSAPVTASPVTTAPVSPPPVAAAPAAAPEPVRIGGQDLRILTFIDAIRVAGIRSSGTESKVLMNDRVYRLNDMVDYTLGIRLTKVATDGLTFTDANGTTYVKNF